MSNSPNRRVRYAKRANLEAIDKALALVGGSHMAAAKLLDMEPKRLSNMVGGHAWLKTKWGKQRGRPPRWLGFTIHPYCPGTDGLPGIMARILDLPASERQELAKWLWEENRPSLTG